MLDHSPGTYTLILHTPHLHTPHPHTLPIGRLGTFTVSPGHYLYIGSAFGPGGLAARVGRHARSDKPLRWHIDYLRPALDLCEVWYSTAAERLECRWAQALLAAPGVTVPLPRFGASDCRCPAHLLYVADGHALEPLRVVLGAAKIAPPPSCKVSS